MNEDIEEFPNLKDEIEKKTKTVSLKYVDEEEAFVIEQDIEKNEEEAKKEAKKTADPFRFAGYDPNVIDFIRRCDTSEQAYEIIDYLKQKGDISTTEAQSLRKQIEEKGIRSFGEKKETGFYFKQSL